MNIKSLAQRLTIDFLLTIKEFPQTNNKIECNPNYKKSILKEAEEILNGGLEAKTILLSFSTFKDCNEKYKEVYNISEALDFLGIEYVKKPLSQKKDELIETGKFYYHPFLQDVPPPPRLTQLDSGEFVYVDEQEFFLEIKESFTLDDLLAYYYNKFKIKPNNAILNRDKSIFKRLFESYGLDIIMFGIDETYYQTIDRAGRVPTTPFVIQNFMDEINTIYDDKKDEAFRKGLNHVITRKIK